jgi:peptide-methionine (S)-S-oxide reductase
MFGARSKPMTIPSPADALPGRVTPMRVAARHAVLDASMEGPWPGMSEAIVAMGCYWGVERKFWKVPGVVSTAVGFAGGHTPHPTYREACTGWTGHTEVVRVIFDPARVTYAELLRVFWENHDPTQGMRQGGDVGTQYRSAIYTFGPEQHAAAVASRDAYQARLSAAGFGPITTEIAPAGPFYHAEDEHQQYLHKNPEGYCGIGGTGVSCPIGTGA